MIPGELIAERDRLRVANASLIASNTTLRAQRNAARERIAVLESELRATRLSPAICCAEVGVNEESAGAGREARTGFPCLSEKIPAARVQVGAAHAVALVGISAGAVCPAGSYCAVRGGRGHAE